MSGFSQSIARLAISKIRQFGEPVTFNRETDGEYDPGTGLAMPMTGISFSGYGVPEDFNEREIDNTIILRGDMRLNVGQLDYAPEVGDVATLTTRTKDYRVINVNAIPLSGDDVLYILHLR